MVIDTVFFFPYLRQISDVRLKCVLSLQALYGDPALLPKLDLFTSRFKVNTAAVERFGHKGAEKHPKLLRGTQIMPHLAKCSY